MATASSLQMKSPQASTHASFGVSDAGPISLAALTLDDLGWIRDCNRSCEQMFGYRQDELTGRHVSLLLPLLGDTELVLEERINPRLAYLSHCAIGFQCRHRDGRCFMSELFINRLDSHNIVVLLRRLEGATANVVSLAARPIR